MLRIHCIRLVALSVSIVGLTSCRKDAGQAAPAAARPPRHFNSPLVLHKDTYVNTENWGKAMNRDLELGESIEVGDQSPPYTEIHTTCGQGPNAITYRANFDYARSIPVFKFLPEEVLARDLQKSPEDCHFIIQMGESPTQKMGYEMVARITGDHGAVDLSGRDVSGADRPRLRGKDLLGHKVIYNAQGEDSEAQLLCDGLTFPKLKFDGELDLADFRVEHPHAREDANAAKIVAEKPDQLCRVVISKRSTHNRDEITKLFSLRLNADKLQIQSFTYADIKPGTLAAGATHEISSYAVTNLEDDTRRVRFNKEWFNTMLAINIFEDPEAVASLDGHPWTRVFVATQHGRRPLGENEIVSIPPHETARFWVMYTVGGDLKCHHSRVQVKVTDDIVLYDLSATGNVVSGTSLPKPDFVTKVQYDPASVFHDYPRHDSNACSW